MSPGNSEGGPRHRDRPTAENAAAAKLQVRPDGAMWTPVPGPTPRLDAFNLAAQAGRERQRRRLTAQLERAVAQRRSAGDVDGERLAAAWLEDERSAA